MFLSGFALGAFLISWLWLLLLRKYTDLNWYAKYINRKKKIDNQRKRLAKLEVSNAALKQNGREYRRRLLEMEQKDNIHGCGY